MINNYNYTICPFIIAILLKVASAHDAEDQKSFLRKGANNIQRQVETLTATTSDTQLEKDEIIIDYTGSIAYLFSDGTGAGALQVQCKDIDDLKCGTTVIAKSKNGFGGEEPDFCYEVSDKGFDSSDYKFLNCDESRLENPIKISDLCRVTCQNEQDRQFVVYDKQSRAWTFSWIEGEGTCTHLASKGTLDCDANVIATSMNPDYNAPFDMTPDACFDVDDEKLSETDRSFHYSKLNCDGIILEPAKKVSYFCPSECNFYKE